MFVLKFRRGVDASQTVNIVMLIKCDVPHCE